MRSPLSSQCILRPLLAFWIVAIGSNLLLAKEKESGTHDAGVWVSIEQALSRRQYVEALRLVEPILKTEATSSRAWSTKGIALWGLGKRDEARTCLEKALLLKPDFLPALEATAQLEYNSGDPRASEHLKSIIRLRPENQTAHAMLGALAFERKECATALGHFEKSAAIISNNSLALWEYGQCLFAEEKPERAAEAFERLLSQQPDNSAARYNLGLAQLKAGKFRDAIATLKVLSDSATVDAESLNLLASAYEADHQTDAAVAALRRAAEIAPKEVRNYLDLAALCMDHSAYALGIEIVEVGLKNIPDSTALLAMRGILRAQLMEFDEAEADFNHANQLAPDQVYGTVGLGITFMQRGNAEDSVRVLRERLARAPEDATLNYLLAEALLRAGIEPGKPGFEEAKSALLKSVRTRPDFAKAHARLGKLYLMSRDTPKALQECELAFKLDPNDRMAVYNLTQALREAGRGEEAVPLLAKFREIDARQLREELDKNRVRLVKAAPPRPIER